MTEPAAIEPRICPYLGVLGDPQSRFSYPSRAHLCHAGKPARIDLAYQTQYCLGGRYESCARYQRAEGAGSGSRSTGHHRAGRPVRLWAALGALLVVAVVSSLLAVAFATGILAPLTGGPGTGTATDSAIQPIVPPVASVEPTQQPLSTLSPALTAAASVTAAPSAAASVTAAPTTAPVASPARIHVVQPGDSLLAIGNLYSVPWQLIAEENELDDPSVIFVGQELVIPQSPGPGDVVHVVRRGETLASIAALYGLTPAELADANAIEDADIILVGQRLFIPGVVATPAP